MSIVMVSDSFLSDARLICLQNEIISKFEMKDIAYLAAIGLLVRLHHSVNVDKDISYDEDVINIASTIECCDILSKIKYIEQLEDETYKLNKIQ